jgi:hypothetical protein
MMKINDQMTLINNKKGKCKIIMEMNLVQGVGVSLKMELEIMGKIWQNTIINKSKTNLEPINVYQ